MRPEERLLSCKELTAALRRGDNYVYQMRRRGFRMPGGRSTLQAALDWLDAHPRPYSTFKPTKP